MMVLKQVKDLAEILVLFSVASLCYTLSSTTSHPQEIKGATKPTVFTVTPDSPLSITYWHIFPAGPPKPPKPEVLTVKSSNIFPAGPPKPKPEVLTIKSSKFFPAGPPKLKPEVTVKSPITRENWDIGSQSQSQQATSKRPKTNGTDFNKINGTDFKDSNLLNTTSTPTILSISTEQAFSSLYESITSAVLISLANLTLLITTRCLGDQFLPKHILLANIFVVNIIFGCMIPLTDNELPIPEEIYLCVALGSRYIINNCYFVSSMTLVLLAADQFTHIVYPLTPTLQLTRKKARIVVIVIWVVAIILTGIGHIIRLIENNGKMTCLVVYGDNGFIAGNALYFVNMMVATISHIVFSAGIIRSLRNCQQLRAHTRVRINMYKTSLILFSEQPLLWWPYLIYHGLLLTNTIALNTTVLAVMTYFMIAKSLFDPIVCVWRMKEIRSVFRRPC